MRYLTSLGGFGGSCWWSVVAVVARALLRPMLVPRLACDAHGGQQERVMVGGIW